ncbi:hypothetical protein B0J11DRAFT_493133 [Dendryphion nanum]|uniref:ubiquitinyl hydrolase 1 n=1 Tax=Dendryphion nanum TaxID=256645 RepID=A0A9P9DEL3_9PLEO|nr:hypothetical protein B0J11DRAFT_493133 [Dendryphion nanum]
MMEAIGSPAHVSRLKKRVRDDVNFGDAQLPWRRLPLWMVLRVVIQQHLRRRFGNESGRAYYKSLIVIMLAELLPDCTRQLAPELTLFLKSKICRRLAKLELEKITSPMCELLLSITRVYFKNIIEDVSKGVDLAWENFKRTTIRPITMLPHRADKESLRLTLPNSGTYLMAILSKQRVQSKERLLLDDPTVHDTTINQVERFTDFYFELATMENMIKTGSLQDVQKAKGERGRCSKLAEAIFNLFLAVGTAYDSNPEQISGFVLNLFTLWVEMDKYATALCPLILEYHPVFDPELLDALHLPRLSDMRRLFDIQKYIRSRCDKCQHQKTIFAEPDGDSFSVAFFEQSSELKVLSKQIDSASNQARQRKISEFEAACTKYDNHSRGISEGTCVCTFNHDGTRSVRGCTKCWHRRVRKRMKIGVHEDYLPKDHVNKAALVFELGIPNYLAAYRNATWQILKLAHPTKPAATKPVMILKDYPVLKSYMQQNSNGLSFASSTKSFVQSHYRDIKMKAQESDVVVPLGLKFTYFDTIAGFWVRDLNMRLTLQHLCAVHVPPSLRKSIMPNPVHPPPEMNGNSSYEIIANQTHCPSSTPPHEFQAYQRLLSGKSRRWLTMLVELGASDLNFSGEDIMHTFNHLAAQAGPASTESRVFRDVHILFQDESFCNKLAGQISARLHNIRSNWREVYCMEMLITLSFRLYELAPSQESGRTLLQEARDITLQWITRLRIEVRSAPEASVAETIAQYAFSAALLCRRTFSCFVDSEIQVVELEKFIQASLALQQNLLVDLTKLKPVLKTMLIRDTKMIYELHSIIRDSIRMHPQSVGAAINASWSDEEMSTGRTFFNWEFLSAPYHRWVVSQMTIETKKYSGVQVIHYNFVEGHLLVDGKSLGRLPRDIRDSIDVKELFGNQHLLTYPSALFGMSYVMSTPIQGNEIHFGLRKGVVVVQARTRNSLLEYIPHHKFGSNNVDLPFGLMHNCSHWLNLDSNCLEIRRKPVLWKTRMNDWIVDVANRVAKRSNSTLVDPHSVLFRQVASLFEYFEDPRRLTVFQPMRGRLSVELRHLELSFFVNEKQLLQCRELNEEIDPNQDAGTLYGFQSQIVLRGVRDPSRRSIITPLGPLSIERRGMHVAIRSSSSNDYGRYEIDNVLGQLSCPPEPLLLYSKAQFHAFTSFALPDPLTRRTGTEEAIYMLKSGRFQPWMPLVGRSMEVLNIIAALSPVREYYPPTMSNLQNVNWNPSLTMTIQHDAFDGLVKRILSKSERLRVFDNADKSEAQLGTYQQTHLHKRGAARRRLYERSVGDPDNENVADNAYTSRGQNADLPQSLHVYRITKLICTQPFSINITRGLSEYLEQWDLIGGFHTTVPSLSDSLNDCVESRISEQWGGIVNLCRDADPQNLYGIMFRLSLMTFIPEVDMDMIKILAAFACIDQLKVMEPPPYKSFNQFRVRNPPSKKSLFTIIAADIPIVEGSRRKKDLARETHYRSCTEEGRRLAQHLIEQWPNPNPKLKDFQSDSIDVNLAVERVHSEWRRLQENIKLSTYVDGVQSVINRYQGPASKLLPQAWALGHTYFIIADRAPVLPSITTEFLAKTCPSMLACSTTDDSMVLPGVQSGLMSLSNSTSRMKASSKESSELRKILATFTASSDVFRKYYGNDLQTSLDAFEKAGSQLQLSSLVSRTLVSTAIVEAARDSLAEHLRHIRRVFSTDDDRFQWLDLGNLWPCTTTTTLLEQLRSASDNKFGDGMKEAIVMHGTLITNFQRILRVKDAQLHERWVKLHEELANPGHENWKPIEYPDWLLFEVDSNIMIRPEQVDVAHAIIAPESNANSVLQLNMGKGKTSCVIPMAMAILGDGKKVPRLIVPKSLILQTAQVVQSRLGGLVGREVRHMPFSRRTDTSSDVLHCYEETHRYMLRYRGVILSAPEHVLSFKLSGLQHLADARLATARQMIDFQSWLNETCRDVLDESDITLAVKTQLIYPSGPQVSVDGHPHRWKLAQMVLSLTLDHLPELSRIFPRSIEVINRDHGFPMIYFLQDDVEEELHHRLTGDISGGKTPFLQFSDSAPSSEHVEVKKFLSSQPFNRKLFQRATQYLADREVAAKNLLLVHGLISNRILLLCLKKRWNVQYGLHPRRDPIAVPFEAKSVPSEQAEFGHPDVAIIFTCLAFYYTGLTPTQFNEGLRHILSSHDPSSSYDRWISGCHTLPEALHHWNVINIDDHGQLKELYKHLRCARTVLNHYMNQFVFPVHAKQFGLKLQASGWDLPLFAKMHPKINPGARTTGFSGTNDNKMMLPLTIAQDDLPKLHQTNAEVLTYLLQPRNRQYHIAARGGRRLTEEGLLKKLSDMRIRVLIDAGAYILEMDNETLVKKWLDMDTQAKAAVYFGSDNRAWVRYRGNKAKVPLLATAFVDKLEDCIVYFDEAHTRGIDLKLPQESRGALTLALGQTKDHTVQAAMRLRQLATSQSLVFFAFPETHQGILDVCKLTDKDNVNSSHVIHWLLEQTCRNNLQLQGLYQAQGNDFCYRMNAEWKNSQFLSCRQERDAFVGVLQHSEQQTLEQLYGRSMEESYHRINETPYPELQGFLNKLAAQRNSTVSFTTHSALEEVEQEREVEFQVEEIREIQKPIHYKALRFPGLHPEILRFVCTGVLDGQTGYEHVFAAISRTVTGHRFGVSPTPSALFVSVEFMKTIKTKNGACLDDFMRPVEWILWCPRTKTALVVISEEVELLIPIIRARSPPRIHLITYAAPVTKKMLNFSNLSYYAFPRLPDNNTFPTWLTIELGILAGRLYMDFMECAAVHMYLRTPTIPNEEVPMMTTNSISFLLEWLALRRKGQDVTHTPIGYICQGRPLDKAHSFFITQQTSVKDSMQLYDVASKSYRAEEEVDSADEWEVMDRGE